jgi:hypothetical protein
MKPSLDACITKVDRAKEHIYNINDQIVAGKIKIDPRSIRAKHHVKLAHSGAIATNEILFHIVGSAPAVPLIFSILAGETVYQLRSALDHLVYQLVTVHMKKPPSFNSAFPVVGKGRMTKHGWRSAADEYMAQTGRLKQEVSGAAETFINQLQPFHRGDAYHGDPLWMLNELNNTDKHRVLNLTVHGISSYSVNVISRGERFDAVFTPATPFEDGAELGRMRLQDGRIAEREVSVDGDLVIQAAFHEISGRRNVPIIPLLTHLADYVDRVIKAFMCLPEWGWTVTWPLQFPPPWAHT